MTPNNRKALAARVVRAAWAALSAKGYVSPIDVLVGVGRLAPDAVERWRRGQTDYLERVVQANLSRISEAMKLFRAWAAAQGLSASRMEYLTRRPHHRALRFSKSGHPTIETSYRTHWVSPKLAAAAPVEFTPDRTNGSNGHAARSRPSVPRPASAETDRAAAPAVPCRHKPEMHPAPRC
jgi:hypothetical protein